MSNGSRLLDMSNVRIVGMEPESRANECLAQIKHILDVYNCGIVPIVSIRGDGGMMGGFEVVPKQKVGG